MTIDIRIAHLFSALDDTQVRQLLESSHIVNLQDGQSLFESGDEAERFFLVLGGQIKLYRLSMSGGEKIIDIIQPGNTFAEAVMFMERPTFPVSAAALGPARVLSFDSRRFLSILHESVDSCLRIMGTMSQRLRGLVKEIDDLTLQSATTRMCSMLMRRMKEVDADHFTLPAAKGVLAARISMKPETFSRIFHHLAELGVIRKSGNEIMVLDAEELRRLAHEESLIGLEPEEPHQNPCPMVKAREI